MAGAHSQDEYRRASGDDEEDTTMTRPLHLRRPAETTAAASALALLACRLLGVDDVDVVTALAIVIGAVPAAVTAAVLRWRTPR